MGDMSLLEGRVPHVGDVQCVAELRSECAADAAGGIRPWANVGVSKGSDEAVAELSASVADEAVAELADDKSLLKGRVPQVDDWVDAWTESTEQVNFRKQAHI